MSIWVLGGAPSVLWAEEVLCEAFRGCVGQYWVDLGPV